MTQSTLRNAAKAKNDEVPTPEKWFYSLAKLSQWKEKEIFKGKTLLLPCDDYEWSGFAKYFIPRFKELGIAKLICRNYNPDGTGKVYEQTEGEITVRETEGHGDFREPECQRLLEESDMVLTNPPLLFENTLL